MAGVEGCNFKEGIREGLTKKINFDQRPDGGYGGSHVDIRGKGIQGRGNSK